MDFEVVVVVVVVEMDLLRNCMIVEMDLAVMFGKDFVVQFEMDLVERIVERDFVEKIVVVGMDLVGIDFVEIDQERIDLIGIGQKKIDLTGIDFVGIDQAGIDFVEIDLVEDHPNLINQLMVESFEMVVVDLISIGFGFGFVFVFVFVFEEIGIETFEDFEYFDFDGVHLKDLEQKHF